MKNYIDLVRLKANEMTQNKNLNIILNDDVWEKDTLIVKSGRYLTEELINKLLRFGIKEVKADLKDNTEEIQEQVQEQERPSLQEFVKTQNALILDNNVSSSGWIIKNLQTLGFDRQNLIVTDAYNSINRYFRLKKINFIFTNLATYEKCPRCIYKYSLLRNTHVFVLMESKDSVRKLKSGYNTEVKFLAKPLDSKSFRFLVNRELNVNFLDSFAEETAV